MEAFRIGKNIFKIIAFALTFFYLISIKVLLMPIGAILVGIFLHAWLEYKIKNDVKLK